MNILLDFIPFQNAGGVGGAASFTKAVFDAVIARCDTSIHLYAMYDAKVPVGRQYDYRQMAQKHGVTLLDLSSAPISEYVDHHKIDTLFISIGQFYANYDLEGIRCKVVMFIHDIFNVEGDDNKVDLLIHDPNIETTLQRCKRLVNVFSGRWKRQMQKAYQTIIPLYSAPNTVAYTVSEYTRSSLAYYFPNIKKDIHVCYSPAREILMDKSVEAASLSKLIESGKPYLMLIAANRRYKNAHILVKVFKRLLADHPDLHLLTLKYGRSIHPQHLDISFLSDSDLEHAYRHAYALVFASFFEGFGYPPIEAIKHGTPVVASNVTSIPEILGEAGLYFSPFYPADLYKALSLLLDNRDMLNVEMKRQFEKISRRQHDDLCQLVEQILSCALPE